MTTPLDLDPYYDVAPIMATFVGGTNAGRTFAIPDDRDTIYLPEPAPPIMLAALAALPDPVAVTDRVEVYRRIMIREDGVRVYRYSPIG